MVMYVPFKLYVVSLYAPHTHVPTHACTQSQAKQILRHLTAISAQLTSTGMPVHHSGAWVLCRQILLVARRRTVQVLQREVTEPEVPQRPQHR